MSLVMFAGLLGMFLGAARGAYIGDRRTGLRGAAGGLLLGLLAGAASAATICFDRWRPVGLAAWPVAGALLAWALVAQRRTARRLRAAILSGAVCGLIAAGAEMAAGPLLSGGPPADLLPLVLLAVMGLILPAFTAMLGRRRQGEWVVLSGPCTGMRFPLPARELTVGRSADCDLPLCRDAALTERHVILRCTGGLGPKGGRFTIRDTHDWPTIRVNGRPVLQCPLVDADRVALGSSLVEHRQGR